MSKYDTLLFDWDGNLGQTLEAWHGAIRNTYVAWGMTPPPDTVIAKGLGNWQWPLKFGLPESELPRFNAAIVETVTPVLEHVELYPGAKQALELVEEQGIRRSLVSSSTKLILSQALEYHGLDDYFETVITEGDVSRHKPDPECVELALSRMGVDKSVGRIAIVGDSDKDLGAANAIGIDCLLFAPDSHKAFYDIGELMAMNPTDTFTDWSQFDEMILDSPLQ